MTESWNRKRKIQLNFRVSEKEYNRIHSKMEEAGIKSLSAYLRKMSLDGYVVSLDLSDIREMVRLLSYCSNNLNQYAKKANTYGRVYQGDIEYLKRTQDELWKQTREILRKLSCL
ncbi:MAG: plasmid mobilization relaxosome protein MobC [Lachnospiraceae bacterium]|nr:plasmid mobilization relaxosome protein MobC [Lachnospiraceae bacterium]